VASRILECETCIARVPREGRPEATVSGRRPRNRSPGRRPLDWSGFVPIVELLVKERLTGAIILVVLIVLLVPELLSGPKGPSAPVSAGTAPTSSEEPPLRSYTINLGDDSQSRPQSAESSGPAMPQSSGPEQPTVQPGVPTPDASKAQSEPTGAASQASRSQSSSPSKVSGAPQTSGTPQATGTPQAGGSPTASSQPSKSRSSGAPQASSAQQSSGAPLPSNARQAPSAQAARPGEAAVPAQSTAKSTAPAQKPTPPPSATPPRSDVSKPARAAAAEKSTKARQGATTSAGASTSEIGWAVQLGVFASRDNAERLALEVRVKGFKASVSRVTSGSRKLYRVRVGPTADRAAAQELQGRLKAAGRPGGTVVPYS
jgi:cell division septation protein DedD